MTAPIDTPREGPTHTEMIEAWQQERRDRLGALLAIQVREYAGMYGEEMAREFITQGFASFYRDREAK